MPPLLVIAHFFKKSFIILSLPSNFSVITLSILGILVLKSKIPPNFCFISSRIFSCETSPIFPSFFTLKIIFIASFGILSANTLTFLNVKRILLVSTKDTNFETTLTPSGVKRVIKSYIGPLCLFNILSISNLKDQ